MRLRSGLLRLLLLVLVFGVASRSHASAILFNDRAEFGSFLEGDYQLFTEFPITDFSYISSSIGIGDYGGVRFVGDPFNQILFSSTLTSIPYPRPWPGYTLSASVTQQVTAIGFDLVASTITPYESGSGFCSLSSCFPYPIDALFGFETTNGLVATTRLAPISFFGVVLINDTFSNLQWNTVEPGFCPFLCPGSVSIDNLAAKTVPEPSSALLLLTGASALIAARRRR